MKKIDKGISKNYDGALPRVFFGRFKRKFRRFTGGKSRNLRLEDAEKGTGKAAGRIFRDSHYFTNCLDILKGADFNLADENDIYRTGVIGQFNLTFKLAWKALQAVLSEHGVEGADTGSPREILMLGYRFGFVNDSAVWLSMLKKRNIAVHIYNEEEIDETLLLIRDSFIPAFAALEKTLFEKMRLCL